VRLVRPFGDEQRIVDIQTEISDRFRDLAITQQNLVSAKVAG
jgi:hypothetical protein